MSANSKHLALLLSIVAVVFIGFAIALSHKDSTKDEARNRVPTLVDSQLQAQRAAQDAQAAATQAQQAAKDVQDRIAKLDTAGRTSDGELKAGRPETSGPGTVTEIRFDDGFLFTERGGYVKKFEPLCGSQTIPAGRTVILQYHWKVYIPGNPNSSNGQCYMIDGYTEVK
jgi:hypothetical protein